MNFAIFFGLALASVLVAQAKSDERTWTDKSGLHRIKADLVEQSEKGVRLRKSDGTVIEVSIDALSKEDVDFLRDFRASSPIAATPKSFRELQSAADVQRTAVAALNLYRAFLANKHLPEVERKKAEAQITDWVRMAHENRIRVGRDWMPPDKAKEALEREKRLIAEGLRFIETDDFSRGGQRLVEASKANQGSIKADLALGLFYALYFRKAPDAEKHFAECVKRRLPEAAVLNKSEKANLLAALNNLSLAKMRIGRYSEAAKLWKITLELAPTSTEVLQNLGRAVHLSKTGLLKNLPPALVKEFTDLYARATVSAEGDSFDPGRGWLYLPLFTEPDQAEAPTGSEPSTQAIAEEELVRIPISSGTAFAVHPGFLLTNRQIVDGASITLVTDPTDPRLRCAAEVIARTDKDDLALIKCEQIRIPPLSLKATLPRIGEHVAIIGFSEGGTSVKAVTGDISALPTSTLDLLLCRAAVSRGNSGGPMLDQTGGVVGVCTVLTTGETEVASSIPIGRAIKLLKENIPGLELQPTDNLPIKAWAAVIEEACKSTVRLVGHVESFHPFPLNKLQPKGSEVSRGSAALEDRSCMICDGHGRTKCTATGCAIGTVRSYRTEVIARNPVTGAPLTREVPIRVKCSECKGAGFVGCRACGGSGRSVK